MVEIMNDIKINIENAIFIASLADESMKNTR